MLCRPLPRTPRPVERTITKPAGGMPTPKCRGRPPAVHVRGESSGPAPALATTVPEVFLIFDCYRGSHLGPVSRTLLAGHTQQGSRPCRRRAVAIPKRRHVRARWQRKKTDLQAGVLCSDGPLVSAYGLMLLLVAGRRRSCAPAPSAHKRADSNRKATSDLRCHTSQNGPRSRSHDSLAHPARKIGTESGRRFAIDSLAS
jgi:hypothetical protein